MRIALQDTLAFVINDSGDIYRCESVYGSCAKFGSQKASDISISEEGDGTIWITTTTPTTGGYTIMYYDSSLNQYTQIDGGAV
jgi:hypothetical protein